MAEKTPNKKRIKEIKLEMTALKEKMDALKAEKKTVKDQMDVNAKARAAKKAEAGPASE